jgi:Spy/CpxP family protein refolding chaperone
MLGFIIGTVCLIGLVKMLRRSHGWYGYGHHACGHGGYGRGYGGDYGHDGHDRGFEGGGPRWGGPRRWFLRGLFERLETTPGQEKAIMAALDELRDNRKVVRAELEATRGDIARAVASGLVDDSTLEETYARQDRLLAQLRVSFTEALKKVTEVLDERQRKQVAGMLEGGFGGWGGWRGGFRGPYRGGSTWA